ncbi:MAG: bifunctional hydroxymethylpyrimidine kinase/phosphomethylpyrimidine kinase [Roseibacillus sp.]|nr:bifunctional hydroxymethylpyrimidine kinase/phosphomethylpyrimidine kinase [Roseibacillus sp.]|tara:strand:+ start:1271 stop:2131 length:861 start_codon:yes stop_codon:yes gene_type:complete
MSAPVVTLTIAGSDCCAGAGIQADLKTFSLLGVHGLTAISTIVIQTPLKVHSYQEASPETLTEQINVLLGSYRVSAIKTGLLGSPSHISAVADALTGTEIPLVVDPVLSASSGMDFGSPDTIEAYVTELLPTALVATPNLPEALRLLGQSHYPGSEDPCPSEVAKQLSDLVGISVLLTGGHNISKEVVTDTFHNKGETVEFTHPWIDLPSSHGSGCTYSAAITGLLALGFEMKEAIPKAQSLMDHVLRTSYQWPSENGIPEIRALNQLPPDLANFYEDAPLEPSNQ